MASSEVPIAAANTAVSAVKIGSIISHIRNNNVSYLLGIGIAHMLGITEQVWTYGSGMC